MDSCKVVVTLKNKDTSGHSDDSRSRSSSGGEEEAQEGTSSDRVINSSPVKHHSNSEGDSTIEEDSSLNVRNDRHPTPVDLEALKDDIATDLTALSPWTRKKIASMQHCQTFSFVDSSEEDDSGGGVVVKKRSSSRPISSTSLVNPPPHTPSRNVAIAGNPPSPQSRATSTSGSVSFLDRLGRSGTSPQTRRPTSGAPEPCDIARKVDVSCGAGGPSSASGREGGTAAKGGGRRSIKHLTSTLVRKLSMKTPKKSNEEGAFNVIEAVNGLPSSQTAGIVSYEGLLRLFACPGCDSMMTPPFAQCKKGHLVCANCKSDGKGACPSCKQRITDCPNVMMGQVYQLVRLPCQFFLLGCLEYHPPKQKTNHEHFCLHRPIHCNYENHGCPVVLPLKDIQLHMNRCQFATCPPI